MANVFPNPDGRNEIEFDDKVWTKLQNMAKIQCTGEEMAGVIGVSYDTLIRRIQDLGYESFAEWFKKYSAGGKMSLRRRQFAMSEHNVAMAIWLGKQWLGQRDAAEVEVSKKPTKVFDPTKMSKEEYKQAVKDALAKKDED